jgi:HD superfamily phosphohydrolase
MSDREFSHPQDNFWLGKGLVHEVPLGRHQLCKMLKFDNVPESMSIGVNRTPGVSDDLGVADCLDDKKTQIQAYANIAKINQLGIKDYLLGKTSAADLHTRLAHSIGAAVIGRLYFAALEPFVEYTHIRNLFKNQHKYFEKLMLFALYLHDVGHLPYSHMVEAVFDEINWTRIKGASHRHDEVPLQQLRHEEKLGIKEAIKTCLNLSTEEEIEQAFDLTQDLIAGISGIPFLDAIINSSIDADKIDYIFRDMEYTETRARLRNTQTWLTDFLSNISLSPEGLVRLNGEAALCTLELLEERQFLYRVLYLEPKFRAFEKIASVIVASWLTRQVSSNLLPTLNKKVVSDGVFQFKPDLRKEKGDLAYLMIVDKFIRYSSHHELMLLLDMCQELADDPYRDASAKEWFGELGKRLAGFREVPSSQHLIEECNEIIVEEPFYIAKGRDGQYVRMAREIARNLHIDYPCGVLIDIVEFPGFLPTPKSRHFVAPNGTIVGETFLVPCEKPSEWSRNKIGRFPLHCCDFTSLEKQFAQVLVINTMPGEVNGPYFLDLFIRRCRENGIEIEPSIWR